MQLHSNHVADGVILVHQRESACVLKLGVWLVHNFLCALGQYKYGVPNFVAEGIAFQSVASST